MIFKLRFFFDRGSFELLLSFLLRLFSICRVQHFLGRFRRAVKVLFTRRCFMLDRRRRFLDLLSLLFRLFLLNFWLGSFRLNLLRCSNLLNVLMKMRRLDAMLLPLYFLLKTFSIIEPMSLVVFPERLRVPLHFITITWILVSERENNEEDDENYHKRYDNN